MHVGIRLDHESIIIKGALAMMRKKHLRNAAKRRRKAYNHKSPWRRTKCNKLKHGQRDKA